MRRTALAVILAAIVIGMAGGAVLWFRGTGEVKVPSPDELAGFTPEQQASAIESAILESRIPVERLEELVLWGFLNRPGTTGRLIEKHILKQTEMARCLSDVALELIRMEQTERALEVLTLGSHLFPNDPDILGAMGVIAHLAGRDEEAREFLEAAESWHKGTPLVGYHLGLLLSGSDDVGELSRAKPLLMRTVLLRQPGISELAALALLTNERIRLEEGEFHTVAEVLEETGALDPGNPNLKGGILMELIERAIDQAPEKALVFAGILAAREDPDGRERLKAVALAQEQGAPRVAGILLRSLADAKPFAEGSRTERRFRRHLAVQAILEDRFEDGMDAFAELLAGGTPADSVQSSFRLVLERSDMPLHIEKAVLREYMRTSVTDPAFRLSVLGRLMAITPLRREEWVEYALARVLPMAPGLTARWLQDQGRSDQVIHALSPGRPDLPVPEALALIEAHLEEDQPMEAGEVLAESGSGFTEGTRNYYQSRIFSALGDNEKAFGYWRQAHNAALGIKAFPLLQNLGFLALELGQPVNALQCLYTAFSSGVSFDEAQMAELMDLTLRHGTLPQTIRVAEALLHQYPGNPVHRNNLAYFKFLAQQDVEESVSAMRQLVREYPDIIQYRLTLALGLLVIGRNNEAKRLLDSTAFDWEQAGTRGQMIYAAVLARNDQRIVAEGLIQSIDFSQLIPEEESLLKFD